MTVLCYMLLVVEAITCHPLDHTAEIGWTSHYSPNVMLRVVDQRLEWEHFTITDTLNVDGYAAVVDCSLVGQVIEARPLHTRQYERLLIADCARPPGYVYDDGTIDTAAEWMQTGGILLEVDYKTAVRWGAVGGGTKIKVIW